MRGREHFLSNLLFSLAALFALITVFSISDRSHNVFFRSRTEGLSQTQAVLSISSEEAIGPHREFMGEPKSPYTLVEFGDYECPPCRENDRIIPIILHDYKGKVRFAFRNLPLTIIHPLAKPAAVAAEAAREQGDFWPMHDCLYSGPADLFRRESIKAAVKSQHLDMTRFNVACSSSAKMAVEADVATASKLDIHATPTFLLCLPNGKVVRLDSLEDLSTLVSN